MDTRQHVAVVLNESACKKKKRKKRKADPNLHKSETLAQVQHVQECVAALTCLHARPLMNRDGAENKMQTAAQIGHGIKNSRVVVGGGGGSNNSPHGT